MHARDLAALAEFLQSVPEPAIPRFESASVPVSQASRLAKYVTAHPSTLPPGRERNRSLRFFSAGFGDVTLSIALAAGVMPNSRSSWPNCSPRTAASFVCGQA